jgi:3'-phosphoadenosine 5'-phosphosulfate (PAPS) 3'-phosphatase
MLSSADAQRVGELMRETAAAELLPRFRALAKEDIRMKGPGDVVTVADEASEQRLAVGLARILPGVPVVGEEAVEKEPGLVSFCIFNSCLISSSTGPTMMPNSSPRRTASSSVIFPFSWAGAA